MKRIGAAVTAAILGLTSTAASAQTVVSAANPAETDFERQLRVISGDPQFATDVVHRAIQSRAGASELRRALDDAIAAFDVLGKTPRPRH